MAALNPGLADLSNDDRQVLDSWLVEFDQRWDEGLLANRLDQIPPGSSWRLPALAEMVKIDLERQWRRGRQVSLESYLGEFPELGSPADVSADLIQAEYEVRRQFGAPLALDDYLRRFPHQAEELGRLIAPNSSAPASHASVAAPPRSFSRLQRSEETPEQLPEQFGRYRIIKRLGQGGMGSVYLAQDTHLERTVALKIPDFGKHEGPDARRRFLEEARTAATLDHPYLCPVYDAGEIDGQPYLTMAYIEGQSLAALIGDEGWPQRQVAALVGKLALALQEAHTQKVTHRDLKPANVMIKTTGQRREPVIVDFGLARRDNPQEQRLTRAGQVMGTLDYMAPEQIRGDLKEIGPACDIYAMGVILYELLTGRLPFSGSGLAVAGKILTQAPLPPSTHRSDLDPALEAICLKAMAKAIGDRYSSMAELAAALTGVIHSLAASRTTTSVGSAASPSPSSSKQPQPAGSDSLVRRFLGQLAEYEVSPPPMMTPEPVVSRAQLPERRLPPRPLIVTAALLGVPLVGIIIYAASNKSRTELPLSPVVEQPSPKSAVEAERSLVEEPAVKAAGLPKPQPTAPDNPPKSITNSVGMKLVIIPAGTFLMGSPDEDMDATADEVPRHTVRIARAFYLGVTEVTVGQFRRFLHDAGYQTEAETDGKGGLGWNEETKQFEQNLRYNWQNPGFEQTDEHPVVNVDWNDAVAFAKWLSSKEGKSYRLPTEADWEYACRAGTTTRFSNSNNAEGLAAVGNVKDSTAKEKHPNWATTIAARDGYVYTSPVGRFQPNAFGLYDMHGNAQEWCSDGYDAGYYQKSPVDDPPGALEASERVIRGGGWYQLPQNNRSASRWRKAPGHRPNYLGFRLALVSSGP
jgi:formylglycine-generating enzyme required for sulfatase activity